jgi:hypothetical protein
MSNQILVTYPNYLSLLNDSQSGLLPDTTSVRYEIPGKPGAWHFRNGRLSYLYDDYFTTRLGNIVPKFGVFGNSIAGFCQITNSGAGYQQQDYLNWLGIFTGQPIERARTHSQTFSAIPNNPNAAPSIDAWGTFTSAGSAISLPPTINGNLSSGSILTNYLEAWLNSFIDTPDVLYFSGLFENDLGAYNGTITPALYNNIRAAVLQLISAVQNKFPRAVIIISTPGPSTSYNTVNIQSTAVALTAWLINTVANTYTNVLVENNNAYLANSITFQPINNLMIGNTGVHPNQFGAALRGKALANQFGHLFPNGYTPQYTPHGNFTTNPDFGIIGGAVAAPGSGTLINGIGSWTQATYTGGSVQAYVSQLSQNYLGVDSGGINVQLGALTAQPPTPNAGSGVSYGLNIQTVSVSADDLSRAVNSTTLYKAIAKLQIVNPANLCTLNLILAFNDSYQIVSMAGGTSDFQFNFNGYSQCFSAGDILTLQTPPLQSPVAGANHLWTQLQLNIAPTTPVTSSGVFGGNNPAINVYGLCIVQDNKNVAPVQPAIGASPWTYTNYSNETLYCVQTGGTVSATNVKINGVTISVSTDDFVLPPGASFTTTYSVLPTISLIPITK